MFVLPVFCFVLFLLVFFLELELEPSSTPCPRLFLITYIEDLLRFFPLNSVSEHTRMNQVCSRFIVVMLCCAWSWLLPLEQFRVRALLPREGAISGVWVTERSPSHLCHLDEETPLDSRVAVRWVGDPYSCSPLQVWRFAAGGPIFSSPCVSAAEQEIFFGSHDCFIYCCSKEGHLRWKFETTARVYATPFAFSNHPRSDDALLAAASTDGKLWVLESRSGELRSVYELPGEVFSSPVVWESMLVIGCRNNYIYCLDLLCGDKNNQV